MKLRKIRCCWGFALAVPLFFANQGWAQSAAQRQQQQAQAQAQARAQQQAAQARAQQQQAAQARAQQQQAAQARTQQQQAAQARAQQQQQAQARANQQGQVRSQQQSRNQQLQAQRAVRLERQADRQAQTRAGQKAPTLAPTPKLTGPRFDYSRKHEASRLAKAGVARGTLERHHVIPAKFHAHPALQKAGFNAKGGQNVMYLPNKAGTSGALGTRATHRGSHSHYSARMERQLNGLAAVGEKRGWSQQDYRRAVGRIIRHERNLLRHTKGRVE